MIIFTRLTTGLFVKKYYISSRNELMKMNSNKFIKCYEINNIGTYLRFFCFKLFIHKLK